MATTKRFRVWVLLLAFIALALGYVLMGWHSEDLEFRQLSSPPGFQELVLGDRSADRSPVLAPFPTARSRQSQENSDRSASQNICSSLYQDRMSPAIGDKGADAVLVEFFDYRCPYCRTLMEIIDQVRKKTRIRVIYKEWPILGTSSLLAARAALAAHNQGKYREFHTRLMQSRFIPTPAYIEDLARQFGMDLERLLHDMKAEETKRTLRRSSALAKSLNLVGTPALVVGRTIVRGAISRARLERLIEVEASTKHLNPCLAGQ